MHRWMWLLLLLTGPLWAAERYDFEPTHTQVHFSYKHMGFSTVQARFKSISGHVNLDAEDWTQSSVEASISMSGIDSGVPKLDEHLKGPDFFDVARFPSATFKSTRIEKSGERQLLVHGDLTLHGVTRPVTLQVTVNNVGAHPMAKVPAAGFDAQVTVKRSDFGMDKYVPAVSDEVNIQITVEALQAKK